MLCLVIYWLINQPYCLLKLMVMFHWQGYSINISPSACCLCWCVHFQKHQLIASAALVCHQHTQPLQLVGESWSPPKICLHPMDAPAWVKLVLVVVGCWLYKRGRAWLPSQKCCTRSSGSLDLWMCMHALRPIKEEKVITVYGRGKLQGQRMPSARGSARTAKGVLTTRWASKLCFVICPKDI